MQLMTRLESNKEFTSKQGNDIARAALLETTLKRLQDRINAENTQFEAKLTEQRKVYGDEKLALQGQIKALDDELHSLRQERIQLMIPINDLRADAELTLEELNRRLIEVTTKQDELDELSLHLTERLDELSDRESKCKDLETTLNLRKIGIDSEAEQISNGHTRLNGQIKDFMVTLETKTKELVVKEESLNIEKKRVQEYLELRTKELDEEKKGLADKRAALEREFNRLNNK